MKWQWTDLLPLEKSPHLDAAMARRADELNAMIQDVHARRAVVNELREPGRMDDVSAMETFATESRRGIVAALQAEIRVRNDMADFFKREDPQIHTARQRLQAQVAQAMLDARNKLLEAGFSAYVNYDAGRHPDAAHLNNERAADVQWLCGHHDSVLPLTDQLNQLGAWTINSLESSLENRREIPKAREQLEGCRKFLLVAVASEVASEV